MVESQLYQSETHVISRKANVRDFWERRLDFLAEHLDIALDARGGIFFEGGRAKPRR